MTVDAASIQQQLQLLLGRVAKEPESWDLRADLFDTALGAGAFDVARSEAERALAQHPEDAAWQHRWGVFLLATKQHAEAQRVFEGLIEKGFRAPAILSNLAFALYRQGRVEAASQALGPLVDARDPDASMAWVLWLRCQHRLDRTSAALERFRNRIGRYPVPPEAFGVASIMALDEEQAAHARLWCDAALRVVPDQMEALVTKGTLAVADQDPRAALGWFQRALEQNPADGRCWSGVGLALVMARDLRGADEAFQKAVATMPEHVGTWIAWGWCLFGLNRLLDARGSFERALEIDRNFGESHGGLAVVLAKLGRVGEAKDEIALAKRLDPNGMSARYAEAVLSGKADDPVAVAALANAAMRRRSIRVGQ